MNISSPGINAYTTSTTPANATSTPPAVEQKELKQELAAPAASSNNVDKESTLGETGVQVTLSSEAQSASLNGNPTQNTGVTPQPAAQKATAKPDSNENTTQPSAERGFSAQQAVDAFTSTSSLETPAEDIQVRVEV